MSLYKLIWENVLIYLILFILLFSFGISGYIILEDYTFLESLYMTTITISTVGFGETKPLNDAGRIFTIILILSNFGILTFLITKVTKFLFDGEFIKLYKILSMESKIAKLKNHVIVCGCGQNGSEAIKELTKSNLEFVAIDKYEPINVSNFSYFINDDATQDEL